MPEKSLQLLADAVVGLLASEAAFVARAAQAPEEVDALVHLFPIAEPHKHTSCGRIDLAHTLYLLAELLGIFLVDAHGIRPDLYPHHLLRKRRNARSSVGVINSVPSCVKRVLVNTAGPHV